MINTERFKNLAADQKGAASILIIFMMLILVSLGAFAITSANANYKLSQRALEWNVMYYDLDAKGEEFLSALDEKLAEAEMMALENAPDRINEVMKDLSVTYPSFECINELEGSVTIKSEKPGEDYYFLKITFSLEPVGNLRYKIIEWREYQESQSASR